MGSLPKTVFKYEGFNLRSLTNLKQQSIYLGSPTKFNDPFDCTVRARIKEPSAEEIEIMREFYVQRKDAPAHIRTNFALMPSPELRQLLLRSAADVFEREMAAFLATKGVTCFSEVNDNLLMWEHYGGSYCGFCLEFRADVEPFHKLRQVRYSDEIPEVSLLPFAEDRDASEYIEAAYLTKSSAWAYEREWRAIHVEVNKVFTYRPEALKAIYFSPKIDRQIMDLICIVLAAQNPSVGLWIGKTSDSGFKIEFDSTPHTPLALAQSLGWVPRNTVLQYPPF
jgi:hypothetical protein